MTFDILAIQVLATAVYYKLIKYERDTNVMYFSSVTQQFSSVHISSVGVTDSNLGVTPPLDKICK